MVVPAAVVKLVPEINTMLGTPTSKVLVVASVNIGCDAVAEILLVTFENPDATVVPQLYNSTRSFL